MVGPALTAQKTCDGTTKKREWVAYIGTDKFLLGIEFSSSNSSSITSWIDTMKMKMTRLLMEEESDQYVPFSVAETLPSAPSQRVASVSLPENKKEMLNSTQRLQENEFQESVLDILKRYKDKARTT